MKSACSILAAILLCTSFMFASGTPQDIQIGNIGPVIDLARNVVLSNSGPGGLGNNYYVNALPTYNGLCVTINDTASSPTASQVLMKVFISGDQRATTAQINPSSWTLWSPVLSSGVTLNVTAAGKTYYYFNTSGAARIEISIGAASGGTDLGNAYIVMTNGGCPTSQNFPIYCNFPVSAVTATGALSPLIASVQNLIIRVCGFEITGAASTTSVLLQLGYGTDITCSNFTPLWQIKSSVGIPNYQVSASGGSELFEIPSGDVLCYKDGGTGTGTTVSANIAIN